MKTNAMPVFDGNPWSISVNASRPPAEAPIPTIGNSPPPDSSGSSAINAGKAGCGSAVGFLEGGLSFLAPFLFATFIQFKVYLRSSRWEWREGMVAIARNPQRRKVNRKAGDRRVVRVETKDYLGHPR